MTIDPQITAAIVSVVSGLVIGLGFVVSLVASEVKSLRATVRHLELKAGQVRDAQEHLDQIEGRVTDLESLAVDAHRRLDESLSIEYHDALMRDMADLHRRIADRLEASADVD